MADYTTTVRYRDPATSSYPHPRDRPFTHTYSRSHSRPIHIIDSSHSPTDDILNNTLTQRVLPALLNRSDRDGRPLKVVINQGNLYMEDSALDCTTTSSYPYSSRYGGGTSKDEPNTVIYNAPGSTMAITSPGGTGSSILRRPTSPLIRTVSPTDPLLSVAYDSGRLGRRSFYRTRSRSRSRDRYGQHRRISYYDSGPPSPTYSSLSTISSSSTVGAGPGAGAVIDRRPLAMCLGCFQTQRVCSNGFCSACDFFPNNTPRGASGSSYAKEVYIERPDGTSRRITYESGGHGHGRRRDRDRDRGVYFDEFGSRRIRGANGNGLDGELGGDGKREPRGRSRNRELAFELEEREQESGRDKDRFRAKERAWERMERDHMRGANGGAGGAGGAGLGRRGGRGGNGGPVLYDSDSEF